MDGFTFEIAERKPNNQFIVNLSVKDQDAVDQMVDAIRANAVSLQRLEKQQVTLEDAFLKIVD